MKEHWRVLHFPHPSYNDGTYLASCRDEAEDVKWALYRAAMEHGCTRICVQRVQKLVGNEWVDVPDTSRRNIED